MQGIVLLLTLNVILYNITSLQQIQNIIKHKLVYGKYTRETPKKFCCQKTDLNINACKALENQRALTEAENQEYKLLLILDLVK